MVSHSDPVKAPAPLEGPSLYKPDRANLLPLRWGDLAHSLAKAPVAGSNRREQRRFPLTLKLTYSLKSGEHGSGELSNMGSSGLLFHCGHRFVKGELIKVSLEWPYLLDGSCPLQLCVHGRVLRSEDSGTAIATMKHEFRTARRTSLVEAIPIPAGPPAVEPHLER